MSSNPLSELDPQSLKMLSHSLRYGSLAYNVSKESLQKALPSIPETVSELMIDLASQQGWQTSQLAYFIDSLHDAKISTTNFSHLLELVLSGPKTSAVHTRDTQAVYNELIETAKNEVLLASYAIYNGKQIFTPLIEKHHANEGFKTSIFLDIPRSNGDTTLSSQIVAKYKQDFFSKQWFSDIVPSIYYLSSSLDTNWKTRASMHAKMVIVDRKRVMITSANLTRAAQTKNIEAGVIISDPATATRLTNHFEGLVNDQVFKRL